MKRLSGILFVVSLFLLGGIADGINEGASLLNALWCIPLLLVMWASLKNA